MYYIWEERHSDTPTVECLCVHMPIWERYRADK